jgi:hypothetical protein
MSVSGWKAPVFEKAAQNAFPALSIIAFMLLLLLTVSAAPDGVTITIFGNTTKSAAAGGNANFTGNSTTQPATSGGFIFTMNISGDTQNVRWKAFVGNVSGKLTLDDSLGATIYDWTLSIISGEVYASRASTNINWTGIGCATLNVTEHENRILNHSSRDDNITATFAGINNDALTIGSVGLAASSCRTLNIYENSTANTVDTFEEVVLYDLNGTGYNWSMTADGNVVYAQILEQDALGYNNATTYDFQMLVPERGNTGWASSTAYYFYVELS